MSWNNPAGRQWFFPPGTVLYSDGITPITFSILEKPDVIIPSGGGIVRLVCYGWKGNYILKNNDTVGLTFFVGEIPPLNKYLVLNNCSLVTGDLSDLPPVTYYLDVGGCSLVTGDLSDLPPVTNYLRLASCPLITGDILDLPPVTYYLTLSGCFLVTGKLSDLPSVSYYLSLNGCSHVAGSYEQVSGNDVPTVTLFSGTGMSSEDMDNTLIAYAACTKNNGSFTATNKTRTAASDSAVASLVSRGWTISGLVKV